MLDILIGKLPALAHIKKNMRYHPVCLTAKYRIGTLLHYVIISANKPCPLSMARSQVRKNDWRHRRANIFSCKTIPMCFSKILFHGRWETMPISFQTKELPPKFRPKCMICTIASTNSQFSNGDVVKILFYRMQPLTGSGAETSNTKIKSCEELANSIQ